jgi:cell division protein FtsN
VTPSLQGFDPYEYVRGTSEPPGLAPTTIQPPPTVIIVGERPLAETPVAAQPQAVPQQSAPPAAPAPKTPASPSSAPARPAAPAAKSAAAPAAKSAPRTVKVTEYWIQAGSFSSSSRAEEVSRSLEAKGLAAKTSTRDLDGKTHFRVRVGPHASKAEAEKFLDWIQGLKGFEGSYISLVAGKRTMP